MGKSYTINCIGYGPEKSEIRNGEKCITQRMHYAHTKLEIAQEIRKSAKRGEIIEYWGAQTKAGWNMIGTTPGWPTKTEDIKLPKTVACPRCSHLGYDDEGCGICNFSGITTKKWLSGFRDWQLKRVEERQFVRSTKTEA